MDWGKTMKKKAKKRGRKAGSKYVKDDRVYLIDIVLTCCKCKRKFAITTQKSNIDTLYTKAVKKSWRCKLGDCK